MAQAPAIPDLDPEDLDWDEPVQSVQELAENGVESVPPLYVRPLSDRPHRDRRESSILANRKIPVIDLSGLVDAARRKEVMREIASACEDWGFFQLVNHSVPPALIERVMSVASQFFELPLEEKQIYANTPESLTGYGSRMGVAKDTILDWGDYFLHYVWPPELRDMEEVWPDKPESYRETIDEYSRKIYDLYRVLMAVLSVNLGLKSSYLETAFGKGASLVLRINYYPPCPQPHLTLGLGPHSDAGGMTFLLQDEVIGLQVKKDDVWVSVKPIPNAILVNIADQLQILSNGKYKSVEHRALVNKRQARMTIAVFCNPADDTIISPAAGLVDAAHPPLYRPMTFGEFLASFFKKGLDGKGYVESFKTTPPSTTTSDQDTCLHVPPLSFSG